MVVEIVMNFQVIIPQFNVVCEPGVERERLTSQKDDTVCREGTFRRHVYGWFFHVLIIIVAVAR